MKGIGGAGVRLLVLVGLVGLGACRDSGLPGINTPITQARHREFRYPAYQPVATNTPVAVAGRHWIGSLPIETIPDRILVPVANVEGRALYAVRGRQTPYDRLYSPVGEGRWRPYLQLN